MRLPLGSWRGPVGSGRQSIPAHSRPQESGGSSSTGHLAGDGMRREEGRSYVNIATESDCSEDGVEDKTGNSSVAGHDSGKASDAAVEESVEDNVSHRTGDTPVEDGMDDSSSGPDDKKNGVDDSNSKVKRARTK